MICAGNAGPIRPRAPKNDESRKTSTGAARLAAFVADPWRADDDPARCYVAFRDIIDP